MKCGGIVALGPAVIPGPSASEEPGIHNPGGCDYGFRTSGLKPALRNDVSAA